MEERGIGDKLKREREIKGLSYEKISEELKIQPKFLEALEKEDFKQFPAETYLKSFLKTYSEYLGLDSTEILNLYKSSKSKKVNVDYVFEHRPIRTQRKKIKITEEVKVVILAVLVFIFLICLILCIRSCINLPRKPSIEPMQMSGSLPPLVLVVETTEEVWFEITRDNEPAEKLLLKAGEKRQWEAKDEFNLLIGKREGVNITYNGKPLDLSKYKSKDSVIRNLILTREGVKHGK